jgi:dienelactone hydrolase
LKVARALVASLLVVLPGTSFGGALRDQIVDNHYAYIPSGDGPFTTLVAMPGCSGISSDDFAAEESNPELQEADLLFRRHYRVMAERLGAEGYVVLLINIHTAEGVLTACNREIKNERIAEYVNEAVAFARGLSYVDPNNINVIGWSMGGGGVLKWLHGPRSEAANVQSAITVYPSCKHLTDLTVSMPVLMLLGGGDDIAEASTCERLVNSVAIKPQVTVTNYAGARHGFDIVDAPPELDTGNGMTVGYQEQAADASWKEILRFLASSNGQ